MSTTAVELGTVLDFFNGKAPPNDGDGDFVVYGSNGIIGQAKSANHENAIILGRVGAYCGSVEFCDDKFWASDNTIVVKTKDGFDLKYMYYRLKSFPLRSYAGGAAQPLLTQTILRRVRIPIVLDNSRQVKIASILSAYDDLIENNRPRTRQDQGRRAGGVGEKKDRRGLPNDRRGNPLNQSFRVLGRRYYLGSPIGYYQ